MSSQFSRVNRGITVARTEQKEKASVERLDSCSARLNTLLKDVDAVAHLLPIRSGGDDLCDKVRDGLLLSAFLSNIPGQENLIDLNKLHHPRRNADGTYMKLTTYKASQNQDLLLKAAASVGVDIDGVAVMSLIEGIRPVVLKFVQELLTFDMMARLHAVNILGDHVQSSSVSSVSESVGKRILSANESSLLFNKIVNEYLELVNAPEKLDVSQPLNENMKDSVAYVRILHFKNNNVCSLSILQQNDFGERARAMLQAAKRMGVRTSASQYDIVYADASIHMELITSIVEFFSYGYQTIPKIIIEEPQTDDPIDEENEMEEDDEKELINIAPPVQPRLSTAVAQAADYDIEESMSHHSNNVITSPEIQAPTRPFLAEPRTSVASPEIYRRESHFKQEPSMSESTKRRTLKNGDLEEKKDMRTEDKNFNSPSNAGNNSIDPTHYSNKPVHGGNTFQKNYLTDILRTKNNSPQKRRRVLLGISCIVLSIVLFILAGLAMPYGEDRVEVYLNSELPIKTSNLGWYNGTTSSVKLYVYDYSNLKEAVSGQPITVSEVGPFTFVKTNYLYNVSFIQGSSGKQVQFMRRSEYTLADKETAQNTYVRIPAIQYISSIGNNYVNSFMSQVSTSFPQLQIYFNQTLVPYFQNYSIPIYLHYVKRCSSSFSATMLLWGSGAIVSLPNGQMHPLSKPISNAAAIYISDEQNKFSLMKYDLNSSQSIRAWLSSDSAITNQIASELVSAGVNASSALAEINTIKLWMSSLVDSSTFFSGIKTQLVADGVVSSGDAGFINSFADLGILQFAQCKVITYLSSSKLSGVYDNNDSWDTFPDPPFKATVELGLYISNFDSTLTNSQISFSNGKSFLSVLSNDVMASSFLSSVSLGCTSILNTFSSIGVTESNMKAFSSYIKHVLRMSYLESVGLLNSRTIPPSSSTPGLFVYTSVYDLLFKFSDPNINTTSTTLISSYSSDSAHWSSHKNKYMRVHSGRDSVSNVHKLSHVDGVSSLRGIWKSEESVTTARSSVSSEPFQEDSPSSSWKVWDDTIQRNVEYKKSDTTSTQSGFTVHRYAPNPSFIWNQSTFSSNQKYFMNSNTGLINMEPVFGGSPVWYSLPHFLGADSDVLTPFASTSFSPSSSSHYPYIDVETLSGLSFKSTSRYQMNLKLSKSDWFSEPGYSSLFQNNEEINAPLFWYDEYSEIPSARASELQSSVVYVRQVALGLTAFFAVLGVLLFLCAVYVFVKLYRAHRDHKQTSVFTKAPASSRPY